MTFGESEPLFDDLDRIQTRIKDLIEANLAEGTPYLLSKLGQDLGDDLKDLKTKANSSLTEFIQSRFKSEYTIVKTGIHSNIQAVVRTPLVGDAVVGVEKLVARLERNTPRYNYRFWAAFSVPLIPDHTRYLNLKSFAFVDLKERPAEPQLIVVEADLIAPDGISDRDAAISKNIDEWLSRHGLEREAFLARHTPPSATVLDGERTLLELLIASLDERQLRNNSLSLDVIVELLRKRV